MCVRVKFGMFLITGHTFVFFHPLTRVFSTVFYSLALFAAYGDGDAQETTDSACMCVGKVAATVESMYFFHSRYAFCVRYYVRTSLQYGRTHFLLLPFFTATLTNFR